MSLIFNIKNNNIEKSIGTTVCSILGCCMFFTLTALTTVNYDGVAVNGANTESGLFFYNQLGKSRCEEIKEVNSKLKANKLKASNILDGSYKFNLLSNYIFPALSQAKYSYSYVFKKRLEKVCFLI